MELRNSESGDPALGGVRLTGPKESVVLRIVVLQKLLLPLGQRGRSETLVFLYGIFSSTQEAYEWRCPRHETDPNL